MEKKKEFLWLSDEVKTEKHIELGELTGNELRMLGACAKQMVTPNRAMTDNDLDAFFSGLSSIADRAGDQVLGLVNRLREILEKFPEVAEYEAGEDNEAAGR